ELGFRGRYRDSDDRGRLEQLRRRLYERVFRRAYAPGVDWSHYFGPPDAHTLDVEPRVDLPRLRPWLFGIAGLTVGYRVGEPRDLAQRCRRRPRSRPTGDRRTGDDGTVGAAAWTRCSTAIFRSGFPGWCWCWRSFSW
ncbi:MAG: DotU family type IV/VI secretion system protein, partial [Bacteroidales bacterium]|nr:DotU family type IV/VI secretion system protein [Bacteroidales bacterium]